MQNAVSWSVKNMTRSGRKFILDPELVCFQPETQKWSDGLIY